MLSPLQLRDVALGAGVLLLAFLLGDGVGHWKTIQADASVFKLRLKNDILTVESFPERLVKKFESAVSGAIAGWKAVQATKTAVTPLLTASVTKAPATVTEKANTASTFATDPAGTTTTGSAPK